MRWREAAQLRIAGNIAKQRVVTQALLQLGSPFVELISTHTLQDVLKLRLAGSPAKLQVLRWADEQLDTWHRIGFLAQSLHHLLHRLTLGAWFEGEVFCAPPPPLNELSAATAGSLRMISAARSCRRTISANEVSSPASVVTNI